MDRISNAMMSRNILESTQQTLNRIAILQQQMATGRRVNKPSDDPGAAAQSMRSRVQSFQIDSYLGNVSKSQTFLDVTDSTMGEMSEIMTQARSSAVQGANGTLDATARRALAQSVDAQLRRMVELGNTVQDGRYLFSGTDTLTKPFELNDDESAVDYAGNLDSFNIQIGPHATLEVNKNGHELFKQGNDVFDVLIRLRDALTANDQDTINSLIDDIGDAHEQINDAHGSLGGKAQRLEATRSQLEATKISVEDVISKAEDADFAQTIADLQLAQTALEAGLQAGARVLQPSLLNYL